MFVCTWFNRKFNRIKIENVKPHEKVGDFKSLALGVIDTKLQNLEFIYRGCILNDDKCLSDYEIKENSEIHVIEGVSCKGCDQSEVTSSEEDVQNIVAALRVHIQNPGFRSNVQRIVKSGAVNELMHSAQELPHYTFTILLDPELLIHLSQPDAVRALISKHPAFIKATKVLFKYLNEQNNAIHQQPTTSTGYSYSLDALSDDDDMESNTESSRDSHPITRNSSYNAITSAQLAAAIANATNTTFNTNSAGIPTSPSSTMNIITNEMFSNAFQQAFGNTPSGTPPITPGDREESSLTVLAVKYEIELRQMHELGLLNDRINIRALQATSANIEEAVELVLNGVIE